mmetsp:Transcript_1046/g.1075  ORF Transcript_1046/g.1075 Transcript_1046/m.1075 type:complete len:100 (+) Transcript_1046:1924-2223(+)
MIQGINVITHCNLSLTKPFHVDFWVNKRMLLRTWGNDNFALSLEHSFIAPYQPGKGLFIDSMCFINILKNKKMSRIHHNAGLSVCQLFLKSSENETFLK